MITYKTAETLNNVHKYKVSKFNDKMFLICNSAYSGRSLTIFDFETKHNKQIYKSGLYDIEEFSNNKLITSSINPEKTFIIDNNALKIIDLIIHLPGFEYENYFYCLSNYNNDFGYIKLDIKSLDVKRFWPSSFFCLNGISIVIKDNFLAKKEGIINFSNLDTGEIIWQKDYQFKITKIEVWNYELVFLDLLTSPNTILGIQTKDGNVLWQKTGIFLHIYDDFIYFISNPNHSTFIVKKIEPIKGIEQIFDLSIILEKNNLLLDVMKMEYVVKDNLIYFSFFYKKTLLIVNLKTLKQEWIHKIETNASWINEPRIVGNRLYVLDETNTLHIFEKEKIVNLKESSE